MMIPEEIRIEAGLLDNVDALRTDPTKQVIVYRAASLLA
jgi:hypothetical protein